MATNPDIETDIPVEVYEFLKKLNRAVDRNDTAKINDLYENKFDELTKEFYIVGVGQFRSWPSLRHKTVSDCFPNKAAEQLYSFLFYKHLFTDRSVKQEDANSSWSTLTSIFEMLHKMSYNLPSGLLWDLFDECLYQMTVVYQKRFAGPVEWSVAEMLRILDAVAERFPVAEVLRTADDAAEGKNDTPNALSGFFALITKAKLNVLLLMPAKL